jgi:hypothetical protein
MVQVLRYLKLLWPRVSTPCVGFRMISGSGSDGPWTPGCVAVQGARPLPVTCRWMCPRMRRTTHGTSWWPMMACWGSRSRARTVGARFHWMKPLLVLVHTSLGYGQTAAPIRLRPSPSNIPEDLAIL